MVLFFFFLRLFLKRTPIWTFPFSTHRALIKIFFVNYFLNPAPTSQSPQVPSFTFFLGFPFFPPKSEVLFFSFLFFYIPDCPYPTDSPFFSPPTLPFLSIYVNPHPHLRKPLFFSCHFLTRMKFSAVPMYLPFHRFLF